MLKEIKKRKYPNESLDNHNIIQYTSYLNRDLEVYRFVGIKLNNGEANCILNVKKAFLKIGAV